MSVKYNRSKEYQGSKRKARDKASLERQKEKFKELTKEGRIRRAQNFDELFVALEMNKEDT